MVYSPPYFDLANSYCAREYRAAADLEQARLAQLAPEVRSHGLIIPVVLRGMKHLPAEIRGSRQCYDFQAFSLASRRISRHPHFSAVMREMGAYGTRTTTTIFVH